MEYIKECLKRGLLGVVAGGFINQIVLIILSINGRIEQITGDFIVSQLAICSALGMYFGIISVVYSVEDWSLLKQTVIHGVLNLPFVPMAILAGWIKSDFWFIFIFVFIYIVVYIFIWIGIKTYWKSKTKEINQWIFEKNNH